MNVPVSKWLDPSPMRMLKSGKAVEFFGFLGEESEKAETGTLEG